MAFNSSNIYKVTNIYTAHKFNAIPTWGKVDMKAHCMDAYLRTESYDVNKGHLMPFHKKIILCVISIFLLLKNYIEYYE